MLSIVTGTLSTLNATKEYFLASQYGNRQGIKVACVKLLRGIVEITSGAISLSYRIILLMGNKVTSAILEKLAFTSTWIGAIYIMCVASPFAYYVYRGRQTINRIREEGFSSVLAFR